jgi:hypothetical protein
MHLIKRTGWLGRTRRHISPCNLTYSASAFTAASLRFESLLNLSFCRLILLADYLQSTINMKLYMTLIIFALAIFAGSTTADGPRGLVVTWFTPRHRYGSRFHD